MDRMQFSLNAIFIECNFCCIKMRYSVEPRERIYVKAYGFLSFAGNLGTDLKKKTSEAHPNLVSNEIPKERYISAQERQKVIDELRLI